MNTSLTGKTALVCGASKGIGAAIAKEFSELGANVFLVARDSERLEHVESTLANGRHQKFVTDLSQSDQVLKLTEKILELNGVDIVVCNSGGPKGGPIVEAKPEEFLTAFQQHLIANHILVQKLWPMMKEKSYGRILNVISTSVKAPIPNVGVSNTIRGAVASWAKTMATELGSYGITVNNILPGFTGTQRLETLKKATADRMGLSVTQVEKNWIESIPAKRLGRVEDIAQVAGFLASSAGSYINGINVPVDGGRLPTL